MRMNASKVFAMFPNRAAWTRATGATSAEAWPMFLKNSLSCVVGSDSFCITGVRCVKNGLNASIAWLIEGRGRRRRRRSP